MPPPCRGARTTLSSWDRGLAWVACGGIIAACVAVASIGVRPAHAASGRSVAARTVTPTKPVFGVTIDDPSGLGSQLNALRRLPERPRVRIYFDVHRRARSYRDAVRRVARFGSVMGELLDSSDERAISVAALRRRAAAYARALGSHVAIWEIGNEVNGNWTGPAATVAAKLAAAYTVIRAHGGHTALTLYANDFGPDHCGDGRGELTPVQFTRRWVPRRVRRGLDEVLLSYYPTQCGGRLPSARVVARHLRKLHRLYPHARLGFGEVGLPQRATQRTAARARRIMRWAYALNPRLSYYIGGYFWWYGAEDALRSGAPLAGALRSAFRREARALG